MTIRNYPIDSDMLTPAQAAELLPAVGGRKPSAAAIMRWAREGVGGKFLPIKRIGGRIGIERTAFQNFIDALQGTGGIEARESQTAGAGPATIHTCRRLSS